MKAIVKIFVVALLIGAAATTSFASPVGGPRAGVTRVNAYSNDVYYFTLRGGEISTVSIAGDGDTDLDLYVYDGSGRLIGNTTGRGDRVSLNIRPGSTQTFRIEVRNHGGTYNQYRMEVR